MSLQTVFQLLRQPAAGTVILASICCLPSPLSADAPVRMASTDIVEHLGAKIPLDTRFHDESGAVVRMGDLISGPTIIMPVYYSCTNVCAYQLGRMAGTLQQVERQPGREYRLIAVSFDETETPELAARSKRTYLTAMRTPFPPDGWRFLTGDAENIRRLTDALGYRFQRQGKDFVHPVASVAVSADGTIIRYLYGIAVLPKDLTLAIAEAHSGIAGASIRKMMEYCFTFDPAGKTYVFNLLRVSATVVIVCAVSFLLFLFLAGKKRP